LYVSTSKDKVKVSHDSSLKSREGRIARTDDLADPILVGLLLAQPNHVSNVTTWEGERAGDEFVLKEEKEGRISQDTNRSQTR
jgi:ribosomal protein L13E